MGQGLPACIIVLNKNKSKERENKILFIYVADKRNYVVGTPRNYLRPKDVEKMVNAFNEFKDEYGYCHVADIQEIKDNDVNLNVPRYVDTSKPEKIIDIQKTIEKIDQLEEEKKEIKISLFKELENIGFETNEK